MTALVGTVTAPPLAISLTAVFRGELVLNILDPIWMGLFAVIGAQQALNASLSDFAAILVGCISAFGGAVLRDLLAGEKLPPRSD